MRTHSVLLLLFACQHPNVEETPVHLDVISGCDPLVPEYCAYPYPSDAFLTKDPATATGYRLAITQEMMPDPPSAQPFDTEAHDRLDGFTAAPQILTLLPSTPDLSGAAGWNAIGRSLEAESPTVVLDMHTGERVAHWVELDVHAQEDGERTLYIRLAQRLAEDRTYAVALRGLVDTVGEPVASSEAFAALRNAVITDSVALEARRPSYEAMFDALDAAEVPRAELTLAWWFHTASEESIRGDLLAMRDDAVARLGADGIGCAVSSVDEGYGGDGLTFRRIKGTVTVPWYMDEDDAPSRFVRGADGFPAWQRDVEIGFSLVVPQSLADADTPGPLGVFGHGLMGDADAQLSWKDVRDLAQRAEAVLVGTDWAGMCEDDANAVAQAIVDPSLFAAVSERLQQGMINQIALTRTFAGVCADIPELQLDGRSLLDPSRRYFVGVSQGGILGATFVAVSPDVERGALLVNGAIFPFMIERSIDFVPYLPVLNSAYPRRLDQVFLLAVTEELWEHAEGAGWLSTYRDSERRVLSVSAVNDAEVPNLATDWAMRTAGMPIVRGSAREPWGLDVVDGPWEGSAGFAVDWGDDDVPAGNEAPTDNDGGHWYVPISDVALEAMLAFFETGEVTIPCEGVCDPD